MPLTGPSLDYSRICVATRVAVWYTLGGCRGQLSMAKLDVAVTVSALALILSAVSSSHAATTAPKVVFIGDSATYKWASAFAGNSNWVNEGATTSENGTAAGVLARFQADVVNLHPAVVHIMIGSEDAGEAHDATYASYTANFLTSLNSMVAEANSANIKVVLGIEPPNFAAPNGAAEPLNAAIVTYAAAHNIPVINYADALCGCVGSTGATGVGYTWVYNSGTSSLQITNYLTPAPGDTDALYAATPSVAGYALMTQMAEATINTMNATLEGGYLQDVELPVLANSTGTQPINVNTVNPGTAVQFTPYGYYSNGLLEPFVNSNFAGSTGTWASSNPQVMFVSQKGLAWSLSPGTAVITYTSPTGKSFNRWIMYIDAYN